MAYSKFIVKGEIHVEVEVEAPSPQVAKFIAQEGLTKILMEHRLEVTRLEYHNLTAEKEKKT